MAKRKTKKAKPVKAWAIKNENGRLWPQAWRTKGEAEEFNYCRRRGDKVVKVVITER